MFVISIPLHFAFLFLAPEQRMKQNFPVGILLSLLEIEQTVKTT